MSLGLQLREFCNSVFLHPTIDNHLLLMTFKPYYFSSTFLQETNSDPL